MYGESKSIYNVDGESTYPPARALFTSVGHTETMAVVDCAAPEACALLIYHVRPHQVNFQEENAKNLYAAFGAAKGHEREGLRESAMVIPSGISNTPFSSCAITLSCQTCDFEEM